MARSAIALALIAISLNACAVTSTAKAPCYDRWTVSNYGASKRVELSDKALFALEEALGPERKIRCVHALGDGVLLAINYERGSAFGNLGRYATRFELLDDNTVVLGEEGILIGG